MKHLKLYDHFVSDVLPEADTDSLDYLNYLFAAKLSVLLFLLLSSSFLKILQESEYHQCCVFTPGTYIDCKMAH